MWGHSVPSLTLPTSFENTSHGSANTTPPDSVEAMKIHNRTAKTKDSPIQAPFGIWLQNCLFFFFVFM